MKTHKPYESWFTKKVNGARDIGIRVGNILYHAYPIRECPDPKCGTVWGDDYCPKCGKSAEWRKTNCLKCDSMNAFVFRTDINENKFFIFCQKCNKWSLVDGLPEKLKRPIKKVASVAMDENCPPPIGSLTKPV